MSHENPKDELMIRIATAIYTVAVGAGSEGYKVEDFYPEAIVAIDAVRAYDAERRASVLDVDALKTFDPASPGTLVWLPDGEMIDAASLTYTSASFKIGPDGRKMSAPIQEADVALADAVAARDPVPFVSTPYNSGAPTVTIDGQTRTLDNLQPLVISVKATPGFRATDEQLCEMTKYDPDDYRDLPVAMTGPVEFSGGLTTEKRK